MIKKILIGTVILFTLCATAMTYNHFSQPKTPKVSENPNIPLFIDTMMKNQRYILINSLDTNSINYRLNKLGFNAKSENPLDPYTTLAVKTLYDVYDSIYPNNQFINFKGVKKLLDTFNLYIGSTDLFICDIPHEKIKEMENFKFSYLYDRTTHYGMDDLTYRYDELSDFNGGYGMINAYVQNTYIPITSGEGNLSNEKDLVKYSKLDMKENSIETKTFLIIAPKTCFKGQVNEAGNFGTIKDPIVLAPVEGGYIIVTAW